uniref:Phospholipase A2 n=2 Tax=Phasianus colchicus TaxID=9054 RepID=A0A669PXS5_PHACC
MKTLGVLFLLSVVAAIAAVSPRALWEFRSMIKCTIPDSYPLLEFNDYGCFCGYGGSGTPVDQLDRCCQAHDQCYTRAKSVCAASNDTPYTKTYKYSCENKAITCSSTSCLDSLPCSVSLCLPCLEGVGLHGHGCGRDVQREGCAAGGPAKCSTTVMLPVWCAEQQEPRPLQGCRQELWAQWGTW